MSSNTFRVNDYLTEAELDEEVSLPDGIAKLGSRVPGYEWLLRTRLEQTSDSASEVVTAVLHIPGGAVPPPGWRFCAGQSVLVPLRNILAWVDGGKQAPSLLVGLTKLRQQKLTKELLREGIARWDSHGRSPHSVASALRGQTKAAESSLWMKSDHLQSAEDVLTSWVNTREEVTVPSALSYLATRPGYGWLSQLRLEASFSADGKFYRYTLREDVGGSPYEPLRVPRLQTNRPVEAGVFARWLRSVKQQREERLRPQQEAETIETLEQAKQVFGWSPPAVEIAKDELRRLRDGDIALAEAKKAELQTYWRDAGRPGFSGLRLKLAIPRPDVLGVILHAAEDGAVRAVRTLTGAKEIAAFSPRDLEQLADGIYRPAPRAWAIGTPKEEKPVFGMFGEDTYQAQAATPKEERPVYEEAKREELKACWAQRVGLHEIGLKITEPGEDELRLTFYERTDGKRFYVHKLTGRAALRAFGPPELLQLGASAALALARPADDARRAFWGARSPRPQLPPKLTEEQMRQLKKRCTEESESGAGIAALFPEPQPSAALKRPRFCAHCGHARGCMCPREKPERTPQVIKDPLGGRARNRM